MNLPNDPKAGEKCPVCKNDNLVEGTGTLDQCNMTVLPTTTVECKTCEFKVWKKPASGTPYHAVKRK
jgi:hypothetical protein